MKALVGTLILLITACFFLQSCSSSEDAGRKTVQEGSENSGRYDSEFPNRNCSIELEKISESIKLINSVAYYRTVYFSPESHIEKSALTGEVIKKYGTRLEYMDNTASGTATVIFYNFKRVAVMTCAHVVNFEDTLYSYFRLPGGGTGKYLQSVSVKERQTNYIADFPEDGELDIISLDNSLDVAILGMEFRHEPRERISVFSYPLGQAKELEWGSFVYIFGYPMGYKTLTKALVSSPNRDKSGSFIIDAVFNRGFSGGIILALKGGSPNFELVGMIKALFADYEYVIRPEKDYTIEQYDPMVPYTKELYVERRMNIKYGLSKAIPVESIKKYFIDNESLFSSRGYNFNDFVNKNL
ncbi:MAG TPA: serine protease [Ignavibacteriales bacterium]|nr:serine protease [Ignavibacteriales bacterium]